MASPAALSVMDTPFCQLVSSVGPELASPSSLLVKDASKRKRVNRNAKLKQCKLDARREQWLAQVSIIKPGKEGHLESSTSGKLELGEIMHRDDDKSFAVELQRYSSENLERVLPRTQLRIPQAGNCGLEDSKDTSSPSGSGSCVSDGFESEYSPKSPASASPQGKAKRIGKDCERRRFIGGSSEGNKVPEGIIGDIKQTLSPCTADAHIAEETDHDSENDDWEAAADALGLNHSQEAARCPVQSGILVKPKVDPDMSPRNTGISSKPSSSGVTCEVMARSSSGRAWRPDDDRRPASLPNLGKQQSLPARFMGHKQQWMYTPKVLQDPLSGPSLCPICAEELDSTDSSFEPCVCGFQLCLFCHHKIVLDDGRCPGCRRVYQSSLSASPVRAPSLC